MTLTAPDGSVVVARNVRIGDDATERETQFNFMMKGRELGTEAFFHRFQKGRP